MISLRVIATLNNQRSEIVASELDFEGLGSAKTTLVKYAVSAVKDLNKALNLPQNEPSVEVSQEPQQTNMKGHPITQKQINFLRRFGYEGDLNGMSITEADALIKKITNN